ncbi:uncharacterized protein LOC111104794 [Crassostrea virginica]
MERSEEIERLSDDSVSVWSAGSSSFDDMMILVQKTLASASNLIYLNQKLIQTRNCPHLSRLIMLITNQNGSGIMTGAHVNILLPCRQLYSQFVVRKYNRFHLFLRRMKENVALQFIMIFHLYVSSLQFYEQHTMLTDNSTKSFQNAMDA